MNTKEQLKELIENATVTKEVRNYHGETVVAYREHIVEEALVDILVDHLVENNVTVRKTGHWVKEVMRDGVSLPVWHCDACEDCYYVVPPRSNYCPHCGAKMGGIIDG